MTLKGTVIDVTWKSPHVHFDFDGKELDGKVTNWEQELGPNLLLSQGWSLDSLKIADTVTVNGYPPTTAPRP